MRVVIDDDVDRMQVYALRDVQPSITNCPNGFFVMEQTLSCRMMNRFATFVFAFCLCDSHERNSGGYSVGVPPLPIPNREVKPDRADGTAKVGE